MLKMNLFHLQILLLFISICWIIKLIVNKKTIPHFLETKNDNQVQQDRYKISSDKGFGNIFYFINKY